MAKKETVTKYDLMRVIEIIEKTGIKYWLDGGWGVDVLGGVQSREHRDIDIDFDAKYTDELLKTLRNHGYETETDCLPVRMELHSEKLGYIDIHPFVLNADGTSKQSDGQGGWYEFEADFFGSAVFENIEIPCISAKGQRIFHSGYELREVDVHDIKIIEELLS